MKISIFLFSGLFIGLWISWPGILVPKNWKCFKDIIYKTTKQQISLKAALSVSPKYLFNVKNNKKTSKLRFVSDACFR